jgi:hypothetical protein
LRLFKRAFNVPGRRWKEEGRNPDRLTERERKRERDILEII